MVELNSQLFFIIINILILYFLLKKFLFKPVTEFMENRTKSIQNDLNDANNKVKEAENLKKQYEEMLKSAHSKANEIIQAARENANKEYEQILQQARQDAEEIIRRANESIELERQKVMKEMRNEITSLAFAAASKIVQKNMDTETNKKIIENFLDEEGVG